MVVNECEESFIIQSNPHLRPPLLEDPLAIRGTFLLVPFGKMYSTGSRALYKGSAVPSTSVQKVIIVE